MCEKSIHSSDTVLNALKMTYKADSDKENNEKKEHSGSVFDFYFALSLLLISFLSVHFMNEYGIDWLHTICLIGNISISAVYVKYRKFIITKQMYMLLAFIFIACIPNAIYTNEILKICNIMFIHILQMYWLLKCCGHLSEGKESDWILFDCFASVMLVPLRYLKKSLSFLTRFSLKQISLKNIMMIFIGILISIPILLIVLSQLFIADDTFSYIFINAFENLDDVVKYFMTFLLSIPLFMYLYSANYGNIYCHPNVTKRKEDLHKYLKNVAKVPAVVLITVEVLLCMVYLIFIFSSLYTIYIHMTSSVSFIFSEFARNGFFELCRITVINLFVLSCIEVFIENSGGKIHVVVKRILCMETVCIIISALFRMYLYINAYGFTYKRIYATWLMIVLFGAFLMILWDTFKKGRVILHIVQFTAVCFLILNFINVDGLVQSSNSISVHQRSNVYVSTERIIKTDIE